MTKIWTILLLIVTTSYNVVAQNIFEATVNDMYSRLTKASNEEKFVINDSIITIIESYVNSDSIMEHQFSGVRFLGQVLSPDKNLKVVNWNVMDSEGNNNYYCYFIRHHAKAVKVYKLAGKHLEESIETNRQYSANDWYGSLYYAIQSFKVKGDDYYMTLGYDYAGTGISRKIIEIISFNNDDELVFGNDCLEKNGNTYMREVLEYSSDGVVSLRFNNKKSVIFDHLASFADNQEASSEYYGSALTFDAYILEKNTWKFYDNVDIRNQE